VQNPDLIRAYTGVGRGLVFRLRLQSANQALGHRIRHGRPPEQPRRRPS
jgi:hypothetical protein